MLLLSGPSSRPKLTTRALRLWLPWLVRRSPYLATAYLVPGRADPRLREATMLGVTSVNRCAACRRVHERWGAVVGLPARDPEGFPTEEAAAYRYGQNVAAQGPRGTIPAPGSSRRHRHELEAAAILMQLANLTGNRFLPESGRRPGWCPDRAPVRPGDAGRRSGWPPASPRPRHVRGRGRRPRDRHRHGSQPACVPFGRDAPRGRPQPLRPRRRRTAGPTVGHPVMLRLGMPRHCRTPTTHSMSSWAPSSCAP